MWIPPEVDDPVLLHHPTRKSVGYFGAVRLRDGKFLFAREPTCFDAMTTWNFLGQLHRCSRRAGHRVVVITDNAKYHHAKLHAEWRAEQEPQFVLSYLPPYSPDLNPIERVWKVDAPAVPPQSLLPHARRRGRGSRKAVCILDTAQ